jgi:CBS domain-containing protein
MIKVKEIMKRYVIAVDRDTTLSEIAKIMTKNRVGSVIIMDSKERPISIVTDSDIVGAVANGKSPNRTKARDIPMKKFITTTLDEDILKATRKMIRNGVKRLPVIDNGRLVGIVSDKEILLTAPEMLEVLSEKLKARISMVAKPTQTISGLCEGCEGYSDDLKNIGGKWLCEDCR